MERAIGIYIRDAREIIKLLGNERIMSEYGPADLVRLYQLKTDLMAMVALEDKRQMMYEARRAVNG